MRLHKYTKLVQYYTRMFVQHNASLASTPLYTVVTLIIFFKKLYHESLQQGSHGAAPVD